MKFEQKIQELRDLFKPAIEKAVKENVKLARKSFTDSNGCKCLLSHMFPWSIKPDFFSEKMFGRSDYGERAWSFILGWDYLPELYEPNHSCEYTELSFNLGKELRQYYLDIGGIK